MNRENVFSVPEGLSRRLIPNLIDLSSNEVQRNLRHLFGFTYSHLWFFSGREMIRHKADSLYLNSLLVAYDVGVVEGMECCLKRKREGPFELIVDANR